MVEVFLILNEIFNMTIYQNPFNLNEIVFFESTQNELLQDDFVIRIHDFYDIVNK